MVDVASLTVPSIVPVGWRTLLDPARTARALDVIEGIAGALRDPTLAEVDPSVGSASVAGGSGGLAVFFAARAAATGASSDEMAALTYLDATVERASVDPPSSGLYGGTAGVGWTLAHLAGPTGDPDGLDDVDDFVEYLLGVSMWPMFDLTSGLVGIGVYLLERGNERANDGLATVVARLAESAVERNGGVTWRVDPRTVLPFRRERFPDGYYDTGLAHGQAGVVSFLSRAAALGVTGARDLLARAVSWLLAQRLPGGSHGRYPAMIGVDGSADGARSAWCYGDPAVAIGLAYAAAVLGDDDVRAEAIATALAAADRPRDNSGVVDGSFCHGSAGLMHVFHRLYEVLGDERLADASREWFDVLMDERLPETAVAGFPYADLRDGQRVRVARAGLLEGTAGIGLALLAALSDAEPTWDGLLLLRPAERGDGP
jgi:lantibiotic modifying enzyme